MYIGISGRRHTPIAHAIAPQVLDCVRKHILEPGHTLLVGGARGVDHIATQAVLDGGGRAVIVPAFGLRIAQKQYRYWLSTGRCALHMLFPAYADFTAAQALRRNAYIATQAAHVHAFAPGETGGTAHMVRYCTEHNIPITVYLL